MGKISIRLLAALFAGSLSTVAAASPSVSISPFMTRDHQDNAGKVIVTQINRKDCLTDDFFRLPITLSDYGGYSLELWAGTGCELVTNRQATTATCWQLASVVPQSELISMQVSVQKLLSGRTSGDVPCEPTSTDRAPQTLAIYALLIDANQYPSASATLNVFYRLLGPEPRDIEYVSSGDGRAMVKLAPYSYDQYEDGVQLFCDPPPNDPNAAANTQTITDNAGVFVPVCAQSAELIPGADGASLQHLRCGFGHKDALIPVATDLINGVSYNIALASVDTYGNVGPLSPVACQVPQARGAHQTINACAFSGVSRSERASVFASLLAIGVACGRRLRRGCRASA
ncbi:MAG TPA: hypothetical protein VER96_27825 [Polyangiaceae bacterium]|nr:hypothetical protein [Polyangiaceae bacterium]